MMPRMPWRWRFVRVTTFNYQLRIINYELMMIGYFIYYFFQYS